MTCPQNGHEVQGVLVDVPVSESGFSLHLESGAKGYVISFLWTDSVAIMSLLLKLKTKPNVSVEGSIGVAK